MGPGAKVDPCFQLSPAHSSAMLQKSSTAAQGGILGTRRVSDCSVDSPVLSGFKESRAREFRVGCTQD